MKNCSSTGEVNWCPGAKATEAESTQPVTNQHVLPCASGSWWRVRSNLREAQSKSFMMFQTWCVMDQVVQRISSFVMSEEPSESSKSAEFDLKSDWVFQSQGSDRAQRCESLQRGDWQVCLALKWRIKDTIAVRKVTWLVFYGMSFLWSQLISPNRASSNYRILMRMKLRGSRRSLSAEGSGVFPHTITY